MLLKNEDYNKLKNIINKHFKVVSKSPYSNSLYSATNIDFGYKPEGSYRIADHWNFGPFRDQCMTHNEVKNNTHLSVGIFRDGKYDIIESFELQYDSLGFKAYYKGFKFDENKLVESTEKNVIELEGNYIKGNDIYLFKTYAGDKLEHPTFNFAIIDGVSLSIDKPDLKDFIKNYTDYNSDEKVMKILNDKRTKDETKIKKLFEIADHKEQFINFEYVEVQ